MMSDAMKPYDATRQGWTPREAAHLLARCAGGASAAQVAAAVSNGLEQTVAALVEPQPETSNFIATEKILHRSSLRSGNIDALKNWWLYRMLTSSNSLVETMTLFWHNHFATSNAKVQSAEKMDTQNELLRRHALGDFRVLFREMARDVAMLVWLDGNANRKRHPNENFAREVLELFALGVGNYTESDVKEAARAFTGWHVRNDKFWFNAIQHDGGIKRLFGKSGHFKGDDVLDLCLAHPACPRFLARKLLTAFVRPDPEASLVEALAERIRTHDFQMAPVLRELFTSNAFFAPDARRALIKSPVQLVVGTHRSLAGQANLNNCVELIGDLGQDLFEPPTVKGWEGGKLWINTATMLQRTNFAAELMSGNRFGSLDDLETFRSAKKTVDHYLDLLLAGEAAPETRNRLAGYLRETTGSSEERTRGLVQLIMTLPEYQLI